MRIKVTGYLHTDALDPELVDTEHQMGITALALETPRFLGSIGDLDDATFELVEDDT